MTSILRSSKFFKCLNTCNRNLAVSSRGFNVKLLVTSNIAKSERRLYLSNVARRPQYVNKIERHIRKLDQDVRRSGRISIKELQEVLMKIKTSNETTSAQSLMIIRCCGNLLPNETSSVRLKLVDDIWDTLVKQGLVMDISHYNTLLTVYLENEHKFSPIELLEKLEKEGVEPNRVTYQRLIAAYCQQGNIEGATRILEFMKEKEMPINENIFNYLIMGHSQANDIESAKGILGVMQQANIEPSSDTYTALLCGYAKNGDIDGLSDVFQLADSKDIRINDRQLLDVIYHLAINSHAKLIDMVLPRLSRQAGYNQDAKNTILRLIAKNCDEAALRVFKTMTPISPNEEETLSLGTFVIKQLVNMNRPFPMILEFCNSLIESKGNERALYHAIEASFLAKNPELSLKLISALSQMEPVHQHYYWPILSLYGKENNVDGVLKTLKEMSVVLNMAVPNETLREYVVKYVGPNENGVIMLRQAGITLASASAAVVAYQLAHNNLQTAAKIVSKYRANYNIATIRRTLVEAYKFSQDLDSLILFLRSYLSYSNTVNPESNEAEESGEEFKESSDLPGVVLLGVAKSQLTNRSEVIRDMLKAYLEFGVSVSTKNAESLLDVLSGNDLTPEISELLTKLTSPDLSFMPLQKSGFISRSPTFEKEVAACMEAIQSAEAKEQSTDIYKIQLMVLYCKQQEYDKVTRIKQEMADAKVDIPGDYLVQLLSVCLDNNNLSEAEPFYKDILAKEPKVPLNETVLVKLASLYVQAEKLVDALNVFETNALSSPPNEFSYSSICWKLLNTVASSGDVDKVEKIFNTMKNTNFLLPTNVVLGPLIKVHLVNNDVTKAMEKFEECCSLYRATPWKNELACKLIQAEDAVSLQKLTDLSSQVHGEVNCLYDLVLSFIECGRMRQARKILETPGLRTRHSRLTTACLRYQNEGRTTHLENLVEVTKDLPHIDRSDLYYHLLGSYCNNDEVDKAISLWTQMQEEDVQPTDRFLIKLAGLLKKHNKAIPFQVPTSTITDRFYSIQKSSTEAVHLKAFRRAIFAKDIDKALQIKESISDIDLMSSDRSFLLSLLVNNGRLGESAKLLIEWLEQGLRPNMGALNFTINSLAKAGDIETLKTISNLLDDDLKKMTSFTNRFTHCMVEAGKSVEVLQKLEEEIDAADTPEKIEKCQKTFPRGGLFSLLASNPELISRVENLVAKYKEKGILDPMNIIWINYFINKEKEKEAEIWSAIKTLDRLMYQPILKKARGTRDLELAHDLLKRCQETNISSGALGAIYSCLIDIHVLSDRIDEASTQLDESLKVVSIENLTFSTLNRLKIALESQGKLFKYSIPSKRQGRIHRISSSSSSDSDSDDEVRQKA